MKTLIISMLFAIFLPVHALGEPLPLLLPAAADTDEDKDEANILISLVDPDSGEVEALDMPQSLAVIFHPLAGGEGSRMDLLGDLEETLYQEKKAWGVNMALEGKGTYHLILEGKPFWNERRQIYEKPEAKIVLAHSESSGDWYAAAGQSLEILPLSRPFGLTVPCLFNGQVIADGKPLVNARIIMGQLGGSKKGSKSGGSTLEAVTDANGQFSFLLAKPGWWYCRTAKEADPLKGEDGEMKAAELSTVFWLHVGNGEKPKLK